MKTKLQRILNHPVAKIVAFVPIVNWLYVILFLMCSDLRRFGKFCICIFVSGLLAKLLRVVIPAPFDWLVPYPISCVNAVFCLYELTKRVRCRTPRPNGYAGGLSSAGSFLRH